jgi:hypothetical protein
MMPMMPSVGGYREIVHEESMTSLTINAIKKQEMASDGSKVTVTVDAKYVGDLSVMIPAACYDELIASLSRAKSLLGAGKEPKNSNQVSVKRISNCLVTADVQQHGLVILVFDRQTQAEAGYAIDAETAKKMAVGLVKSADAVLMNKAGKN